MTYQVLVSQTFQKQFHNLGEDEQKRIKNALYALEIDPFEPRSGADIKPLTNTNPKKYRLRIGNFRVIYLIEGDIVKVIEVFKRGQGYE